MVKRRRRSQDWFGKQDKDGFIHRSWLKNQGYPDDMFDGRPVIGICNTWSELTPCNGHFREIAEFVKRGKAVVKVDRKPFRDATVKLHNGPDATWPRDVYDRLQKL